MEMLLQRKWAEGDATIGELEVDGARWCYTLEDEVRAPGVKVPGKTAIPSGRYEVIVTFSNRFQKELPLLLKIPLFEGVRIHGGSLATDTSGCILVGMAKGDGRISNCATALAPLIDHLAMVRARGERCYLTILDIGKGGD